MSTQPSDFVDRPHFEEYRTKFANFFKMERRNGILQEADLLADSYGGKFHPRAVPELVSGLPTAATGLRRGKMTPRKVLLHPHKAPADVKQLFDEIDGREQRVELNLYVTGEEDEPDDRGVELEPDTPQPSSESESS